MEKITITESDNLLASSFKALGNSVRLAILRKLIENNRCPNGADPCSCGNLCERKKCECGCRCGDLVDLFPMSQSTISQHIKELKKAGLIEDNGRKKNYLINQENLKKVLRALIELIENQQDRENGCACCESSN